MVENLTVNQAYLGSTPRLTAILPIGETGITSGSEPEILGSYPRSATKFDPASNNGNSVDFESIYLRPNRSAGTTLMSAVGVTLVRSWLQRINAGHGRERPSATRARVYEGDSS